MYYSKKVRCNKFMELYSYKKYKKYWSDAVIKHPQMLYFRCSIGVVVITSA